MDSERWVSYSLSDLYPLWQVDAHCAGTGHEYYFGTEDEEMPDRIRLVRNASKLCDVCPVFTQCLTHALTYREEYGVWAGTSGRGRRKLFYRLDHEDISIEGLVEEIIDDRQRKGPGVTRRVRPSDAGLPDAPVWQEPGSDQDGPELRQYK